VLLAAIAAAHPKQPATKVLPHYPKRADGNATRGNTLSNTSHHYVKIPISLWTPTTTKKRNLMILKDKK
jgi:hypothetical protein